ncbi:hypothetical protein COCC4DRAFT_138219 [Bipolaris maydis ATCC 48331]|uniref:BTB domain-containing protein n=2 Tax=Cochliobolus heterostrophus TaxID=5016 RepID=M2UMH3_COCH5|nr:uncharacterized protein COCC4DRAFT_138219 [Bipolaris maydis ATCC 48331]EMD89147.1 hypothetical protein COCHEDRAFT_1107905 [Bipolaris maydis C5]KAJ5020615.1 hypothetical protein J3E73DRAFT_376556 [Bipolaris maydis]ENI05133.1 hypothetical protein COCC4DRAFT_138219 [Bipolaris maydis ATCC 48331]KAJ5024810.1 hypothetical protein J3E73DRAFT_392123 [Bipolaris maydis]KAJ6194438.1 hypothetical protein J3E72DRAFT_378050 [Bipolaris maydis]
MIEQAPPSQPPPPTAHPPLPQVLGAKQPDMFTAMIQGYAVRVVVGEDQNRRSFILPVALLCHYSNYFQQQVSQLRLAALSSTSTNKKRKLSETARQDNSTESMTESEEIKTAIKIEPDTDEGEVKEKTKKPDWVIRLPEIDPAIFCLFLHYIYKDAYPASTDINTAEGMGQQYAPAPAPLHAVSMAHHPKPSQPSVATNKGQTASTPNEVSSCPNALSIPPTAHPNSTTKHSPPSIKPPPAPTSIHLASQPPHHYPIPPSFHAYHLSQTLGSPSFTHYTFNRIRCSLGRHFPLTPSLTKYTWSHFPPQSPLRILILHFLITHWAHPDPRRYTESILRDGQGWDTLFEEERELRSLFISGMQGRGA